MKRLAAAVAASAILACAAASGAEDAGRPATVAEFLEKQGLRETEAYRKILSDASLEIKSRNYFRAAELLVKIMKGFPEHPVPCMLLGFTFGCMGYLEQAGLYVRKGISVFPGIRDSDFSYALHQPDKDEIAWLVDGLRKKADASPAGSAERSTAEFLSGAVLFFSGSRDESRKALEAVQQGSAEHAAAAHLLAAFAAKPAAPPKKAERDFLEEGNRFFLSGMYREAAFAFGFAFIQDPSNVVACFELGHSLFAAGEYDKASTAVALGIARYPDWPGVTMDRREFYSKDLKGDFDRQVADLRSKCEKEASAPSLWFLLGYNLHFSGNPQGAKSAFDRAAAQGWGQQVERFRNRSGGPAAPIPGGGVDGKEPGRPDTGETAVLDVWLNYLALGKKAFAAGDYRLAAAQYAKAREIRPEVAIVTFEVARSHFAAGAFEEAGREVRAGLSALPEDERHRVTWKSAYDDKALFEKHLAALSEAVSASDKFNPEIGFLYAFSLFYSGDFSKAAEEFEKVFVRNPQDAQAIYYFKLIDKLLKKR